MTKAIRLLVLVCSAALLGLAVGCGDKRDNNDPYQGFYPGYPGMPGFPPGQYPNAGYKTFSGQLQTDKGVYRDLLRAIGYCDLSSIFCKDYRGNTIVMISLDGPVPTDNNNGVGGTVTIQPIGGAWSRDIFGGFGGATLPPNRPYRTVFRYVDGNTRIVAERIGQLGANIGYRGYNDNISISIEGDPNQSGSLPVALYHNNRLAAQGSLFVGQNGFW